MLLFHQRNDGNRASSRHIGQLDHICGTNQIAWTCPDIMEMNHLSRGHHGMKGTLRMRRNEGVACRMAANAETFRPQRL